MLTIAVIIPVYNRIKVTQQGLKYLSDAIAFYKANSHGTPYSIEVIIVDDGSTDGSSEWIAEHYPAYNIVKGSGNLWWTGAVNAGIQYFLDNFNERKGVVLQNDDIALEESWLLALTVAIDAHPESLIGCATTTMDHKDVIDYGGRQVHPWLATTKPHHKGALRSSFPKGYVSPSSDLYGRGLFIPDSVFAKLGLFNQQQFKHRGDMELPIRARKHGYPLLVSYDAIVYQLPEHTFALDIKQQLTLKDIYKLFTDFRTSYNIKDIYYFSKISTNNPLQFGVFFSTKLLYSLKSVLKRYFKQFAA